MPKLNAPRIGLAAGLLLAVLAVPAGQASGDAGIYQASAAASGVSITVSAPDFLIAEKFADAAAPTARAAIDGLGTSRAMASAPYPGETALTTPGLVAASTGMPSPPGYPLIAESAFPATPEAKVDQPGYRLEAHSAAALSSAQTSAGSETEGASVGLSSATAQSGRDGDTGTVTSESTALARAVEIGEVFRAGAIDARARVSQSPGQELVRESSFSAGAMTVAGQPVALAEDGLVVAGTDVPLADTAGLIEALDDAGVELRYLAPVALPDGVVSAGLVVTQRQQIPSGPLVVTELVFGRAVAVGSTGGDDGISSGSLDLLTPEPTTPVSPEPLPEPLVADPAVAPPTFVTPAVPATANQSQFSAGIAGSSDPRFVPEAAPPAPPAVPPPAGVAAPISLGRPAGPGSTESVYLVLVAGGLVAVALSQLLRRLGVRSA